MPGGGLQYGGSRRTGNAPARNCLDAVDRSCLRSFRQIPIASPRRSSISPKRNCSASGPMANSKAWHSARRRTSKCAKCFVARRRKPRRNLAKGWACSPCCASTQGKQELPALSGDALADIREMLGVAGVRISRWLLLKRRSTRSTFRFDSRWKT